MSTHSEGAGSAAPGATESLSVETVSPVELTNVDSTSTRTAGAESLTPGEHRRAPLKAEEALNYVWEDYKLRQTHYWASVNRFGLAIIALLVVPHVQLNNAPALKGNLWFLPLVGLALSVAASWLLGAEYQRLRSAKQMYEQLLTGEYTPRHPRGRFVYWVFGRSIGIATTLLFSLGFVTLSIVDFVMLGGWEALVASFKHGRG